MKRRRVKDEEKRREAKNRIEEKLSTEEGGRRAIKGEEKERGAR